MNKEEFKKRLEQLHSHITEAVSKTHHTLPTT